MYGQRIDMEDCVTIRSVACRHCAQELGQQCGAALVVGGCRFERRVAFVCVRCGRLNFWFPPRHARESVAITAVDSAILIR
jgi:hypothetical protein